MSSFRGHAFPHAPLLPAVRCFGREKSSIHNHCVDEQFRVDAVLPADLGGAPRAGQQHSKSVAPFESVEGDQENIAKPPLIERTGWWLNPTNLFDLEQPPRLWP